MAPAAYMHHSLTAQPEIPADLQIRLTQNSALYTESLPSVTVLHTRYSPIKRNSAHQNPGCRQIESSPPVQTALSFPGETYASESGKEKKQNFYQHDSTDNCQDPDHNSQPLWLDYDPIFRTKKRHYKKRKRPPSGNSQEGQLLLICRSLKSDRKKQTNTRAIKPSIRLSLCRSLFIVYGNLTFINHIPVVHVK